MSVVVATGINALNMIELGALGRCIEGVCDEY